MENDQPRSGGRFAPGPDSRRNKLGRPKGARGLSRKIGAETRDGDEMIETLLELMRDQKAPTRERFAAVESLLNRYAGRPMSPQEITIAGQIDFQAVLGLPPERRLAAIDLMVSRHALGSGAPEEPEPAPDGAEDIDHEA